MADEITTEKTDPFKEGRDLVESGLGNTAQDTAGFSAGHRDRIAFHEFNALTAWEVFADACGFFTNLLEDDWAKFTDEEKERVEIFSQKLAANRGDLKQAGIAEDEFKKLSPCFNIHQVLVQKDTEIKQGYAAYQQSLERIEQLKKIRPSWLDRLMSFFN